MTKAITLRPLTASDLADYMHHLQRLDGHARAQRFAAGVDDQFITAHCLRAVASRTVLIGLFVDDTIRAASELEIDPDGVIAEVTLAVEKPWRGKGFGGAVLQAAVDVAEERDVAQVRLDVAPGNLALAHIAKKLGFVGESGRRAATYRLDLAPVPQRAALRSDGRAGGWWNRLRLFARSA